MKPTPYLAVSSNTTQYDGTDESGDNGSDEDEQRDMLAVDKMVDGMVAYMPNVRIIKLMPKRASDQSIGYLGAKLVNAYAEQLDSLTSTVDVFATRLMPTLNLTNLQTLVLNRLYAERFWNHFVDDINQQSYSDILCFHRMHTLDLTFGPPVGFGITPGLAHWAAVTWLYIDCVHFVTLVELMQRMQRLKTVDVRVVAFDRPDSPGLVDEFDPFDYPRLLPETPLCPGLETLRLDRFGATVPLIAIVACVKSLVDRLPVLKAFVTADHGVSSFINPQQEKHT
ncbi:hypothetical protein FB645_001516 [Coemansia sp. IMI 203386]|nr:hypothetical protein FB645_001516 [Coemansia sp. IMI 203386]